MTNQAQQLLEEYADDFRMYCEELLAWNERVNLTAITEESRVWEKHFADSLQVAGYIKESRAQCIWDVGTGAGFPGLPLAIVLRDRQFILLDSTKKKMVFVEHMSERLGLKNVKVVARRIEDLSQSKVQNPDIIVARAVAYLPILLELCYGLLKVNGLLMVFKSEKDLNKEIDDAKDFVKMYNLREEIPIRYTIAGDKRIVLIYRKTKDHSNYKARPYGKLLKIFKKG